MDTEEFFAGLGAPGGLQRRKIFTDRKHERHFLMDDLITQTDTDSLTNYSHGATNIRGVYGDGGIGKSTLLRQISDDLRSANNGQKTTICYLNFEDKSNFSFENVLLRIRASVTTIGHKWDAFDLVFASYWDKAHPGIKLDNYIKQAEFLSHDEREKISGELLSLADDVLGGTGLIGAAYRLGRMATGRIARSRTVDRLMHESSAFARLSAEEDANTILGYAANLLAFELAKYQADSPVAAIVLLDTFETVQNSGATQKGSLEDLISRMVYVMPNVPFIVAGRRKLNWDDPARALNLTYSGQQRWPQLGDRQLSLASLPVEFAEEYLLRSLVEGDAPAIGKQLRDTIVAASGGSPLYLDLAVTRFREMRQRSQDPEPIDFRGGYPEIVNRMANDLTPQERDVLRAASLLESFDTEVIHEVLPEVREKVVFDFLERTIVHWDPARWPTYYLHDSLRREVVAGDQSLRDGWSEKEWRDHARVSVLNLSERALEIWSAHAEGEDSTDNQRVLPALMLGTRACLEFGIDVPEINELFFTISQLGYLQPLGELPGADSGAPIAALAKCGAIRADATLGHEKKYQLLRNLGESLEPNHPYRKAILFEVGALAQTLVDYDEAEVCFHKLAGDDGPIAIVSSLAESSAQLASGRLKSAQCRTPSKKLTNALYAATISDQRGHILMQNGTWRLAARSFSHALDMAQRAGSPLWAARAARHIAWASMWFDPVAALARSRDALPLNENLDDEIGIAQCEMAASMSFAGIGEWDAAWEWLRKAQKHSVRAMAVGHPWMIETLYLLAHGNAEAADSAADVVFRSVPDPDRPPPVWAAVTALWTKRESEARFSLVEWCDSERAARRRWSLPLQFLARSS